MGRPPTSTDRPGFTPCEGTSVTMTDWHDRDDMPDWLRPAYDQPVDKSSGPRPPSQPAPDPWAQPAPPPPQPAPQPRRPGALPPILDIAAYQLTEEPTPDLKIHLGTQKMLADTYYLSLAHETLQEAEQQVISFVRQSPTHALPTSIALYRISGIANPLKKQPVQLATILADTILLATNATETCPKDVRHRAILGIAQRIVDLQETEVSNDRAAERIIKGILQQIELSNVQPRSGMAVVQLHARQLVLEQIAEWEDSPPPARDPSGW